MKRASTDVIELDSPTPPRAGSKKPKKDAAHVGSVNISANKSAAGSSSSSSSSSAANNNKTGATASSSSTGNNNKTGATASSSSTANNNKTGATASSSSTANNNNKTGATASASGASSSALSTTNTAEAANKNSAAAAAGGASTVLKKPQELPWWDNVNLDGKPQQYCTRMIGECKRIFCVPQTDMRWEKPVLWDLSRFEVVYETKGMDKDSKLRKDCEEQNLEGIRFEVNIPEKFPMVPPMVRVLHPKIQGGFVFRSGAICFELLTPKGWVTTMGLPSVAVALIGLFADPTHPARVEKVGKDLRTIPDYTREAAEKEVQHIIKAHDGGSSWGQKIKDMKS